MAKIWDVFKGKETELGTEGYKQPEEAKLNEKLYQEYKSAYSDWEKKAREDDEFRRGKQLTREEIQELKVKRQAPIINNVIEPAVEQAKAMLTANKPSFSSTGKEDSDIKTGRIFADLLSHIWQSSDGNAQLKQAVDDYYVTGKGILFTYVDPLGDYGKGEIKIVSLSPFNVFIDPNSTDLYARDASHIIVAREFTLEQLQDMYPDKKHLLKYCRYSDGSLTSDSINADGLANSTVNSDVHKKIIGIERYSKIKKKKINVFDTRDGSERILTPEEFQDFLSQPALIEVSNQKTRFITKDEEVSQYLEIYNQTGGVFHYEIDQQTGQPVMVPGEENENSIPGSTVILELIDMQTAIRNGVLLANDILDTQILRVFSVGGVLFDKVEMPISNYPIVPLFNHHDRTPFPTGDVRLVKDLQRQINKIESLIIAHATSSTNVKLLIPEGSVKKDVVEKEWAKAGTGVITYNPEFGAPQVVTLNALPGELYKNKADKIYEIERLLGIYALQQGDSSQAPNTFRGTIQIDEFGQRRIKSKKDDIEGALNVLAKVIVELIQKVYTEPRVIRLLQPNHLPIKEMFINQPLYNDFGQEIRRINDVTVGKYDIIVVSGSMLPSNRWAVVEQYKELYQLGLIDQQEFLLKTEVADVEGVLERFGQMKQMQQALAQYEEEIKSLKGDLQTLQRENTHLQKKVEVEKFKTKMTDIENTTRKGAELFQDKLGLEAEKQKFEFQKMLMKQQNEGEKNDRNE